MTVRECIQKYGIPLVLVVNVGCDLVKVLFPLSPLCLQVVGTDISPAHINNALKLLNKKIN